MRDVAFAFSDHYLVDATSGLVDTETGRRTAVRSYYRPAAASWTSSAAMTQDAIETFSRNVYPYPWPHITSTEGLVGGMEYPMIVFVRDFGGEEATQGVIAHELGHIFGCTHSFQWDPPVLCNDGSGPDGGTMMNYCALWKKEGDSLSRARA